jgi:DNA-binding XRE family transcriptional regulator
MLAVVKTPRINIRIKGKVPSKLLQCLRSEFGDELKIDNNDDEETIDFFETDIYKEIKNEMTPGTYIRIYRENKNLTQRQLGELVGVSKAYICDIEKNRRSVSKQLAKHFAGIFSVPVSKFI